MPLKKHKPEEIIGNLRGVEIMLGQGGTTAEACRRIAVSQQAYYRGRKEYGGLKTDQARRMKDLEKENLRLRRPISDLTLDKLVLQEAARGSRQTCKAQASEPRTASGASTRCARCWTCRSDACAACSASTDRCSARCRVGQMASRR